MSTDRQVGLGLAGQTAALRAIRSSVVARYGIAVGAAIVAVLLRLALNPVWGIRFPHIMLIPAIMLGSWLGGLWPGIVTTVITGVALEDFWIEPAYSWRMTNTSEVFGIVVFVAVGVVISVLNEAWRRGAAALAESEARLDVTVTSIGDAVVTTDDHGRVTRLNPVAEHLTGWSAAEAAGKPLQDVFVILNEQTRQPVPSPVDRALREGVVVGLANHTVLISRDGREIPIDDSAAPIRSDDGAMAGAIMVFRDVGERRRAEREREALLDRERVARIDTERLAEAERAAHVSAERAAVALRESEERLRITIASIGDAVLATDENGDITQLNPVGEALTDWRQADALGRSIGEVFVIVNEETRQPAPNPVERVLRDGVVAGLANHTVLISKTGRETPIDDSAAPVRAEDGRLVGAVMVFRDITERRQTERERAARAQVSRELAAIVESSDDAILSTDLDATITAWNHAAEQMYGYAATEAIGQSIRLIVSADRWPEEDAVLQRIRRGEPVEHVETVRRRKNGAEVAVSLTASPVRDDTGAVIGMSKIARDITARKRLEAEKTAILEAERVARRETEIAVQQLQAALAAGRMGTWEYTMRTGVVKWSPGLEAIHGYQPGTFPGTFDAFRAEIHPADRDDVLTAIGRAVEERRDHHIEYRIVRTDGGVRWVEGRGQLFLDDAHQPDRMVGVCADITERKHAEERFRLAVEAAPAAMIMVDQHGTIVLANALTERLLGYTQDEIVGQPVERLVPPRFREHHPAFRATFLAAPTQRLMGAGRDLYALRKDGTEVPVEIGLSPIETHDGTFVLAAVTDITARRHIEDEGAALLVREQTARAELERASRLKDEFLAVLSHELRTPLNAVLGYAQLLNSGMLPAERARHALDAIERNAHAQARLVESLLDLSRIMAGKLELNLEELNLATIVNAAVDALRPGAEEKSIAIDAVVPPMPIVADGGRLQQVFWNLLSNAIKFSDRGGRVAMRCMEEDAQVRVQVTDNGQGISANFLPYVFDRFSQADGQTRRSRTGLGLGLALVRELVQAHGGTVVAESPGEGRGSTFTVTLPVSTGTFIGGPKKTRAPEAEVLQSLPPIDILIVDDEGDVRDLLALLVESRGAIARTASSAAEALDAITTRRPDLLLADLRMPDEDGYSLIRKVRARERERQEGRLPAIAVTAYASPSDCDHAIVAGYDAHVAKPVEPADLARAVAHFARNVSRKNEVV